MGFIPAKVHYRPAEDPKTSCADCSFYSSGHCEMFDAPVSPSYVCDEWRAITEDHQPEPVPAEHHNRVLRRASRRADSLEERLIHVLHPILDAAGTNAARAFQTFATDHLTAAGQRAARIADLESLRGLSRQEAAELVWSLALVAAPSPNSTMIAVKPRADQAAALADPDGEPAEHLHVTLAYLGEVDGDLGPVAEALRPVAVAHAPLAGTVSGYGQFGPPADVGILLPDVPGLVELRVAVTEALLDAGFDYARGHGFEAHMTVDQTPEGDELPSMMDRAGLPLDFDELLVVRGDVEVIALPLMGAKPVTAGAGFGLVAAGNERPKWTAPAPDEIIDVAAFVAKLHTRTDPVRLAVAATMMTQSLNGVGLSFDVTNPLVAKVLAQSGSQITEIAKTTQLNVMRIIREAYHEGLSIPDTAKAIREGMRAASTVRATLIARTELAGAVNGGSLAATRIVADATGSRYTKTWLTAPGAKYPRHEDYDGLDGQTRDLDEAFEVGGEALQFPGDPEGDPAEICNCRCTMTYVSPEGEGEVAAE